MKATIVENSVWFQADEMKSMVVDDDNGVRLPGLITVVRRCPDVRGAVQHYLTSYVTVSKSNEPVFTPHITSTVLEDGSVRTTGPMAQFEDGIEDKLVQAVQTEFDTLV